MPVENISIQSWVYQDKMIHILFFGILGYLGCLSIKKPNFIFYIVIICLASTYGFAIECLQDKLNTGRYFDNFDIIANIIGSMIGSIIYYKLQKTKS